MQPERINTDEAHLITGLPLRTLIAMSARGDIWGAQKLGRRWTYHPHILRQWLNAQERKVIVAAVEKGDMYPSINLPRPIHSAGSLAGARVYFIGCGTHLKIGIAVDPIARLRTLQVGNPAKRTLLGTLPGGRIVEQYFHGLYEQDHERGEWFRFTPRLRKSLLTILGNDNGR